MDYFTKQELNALKNEINGKEQAIEVFKDSYAQHLLNDLGNDIKESMKKPSKPNFFLGLKIKFQRWRKMRQDKKELKKIKKLIEKGEISY